MRNGIMVPLDGTRFAEAALPPAMALARRDGLPICLVTVWQPVLPLYDTSGWLEAWEVEQQEQQRRYMATTALKVERASGCKVSVLYLEGRPSDVLPPLPAEKGFNLVVMCTHGRGPVKRAWTGSVADQMVRKGTAPVLLIRPDEAEPEESRPAKPILRILVPLDGSETAEKVLQPSLLVGGGESVEITLIRVLGLPLSMVVPESAVTLHVGPDFVKAEKDAAEAYLLRIAEGLRGWNCRVTTAVVEESTPWTGITRFAAMSGVDLIAMATHGRGGAARLLLGSTAERVIQGSPVPVLLVHPQRMPSPWKDVERIAGQVVGMP